jgi:hypothetical protein
MTLLLSFLPLDILANKETILAATEDILVPENKRPTLVHMRSNKDVWPLFKGSDAQIATDQQNYVRYHTSDIVTISNITLII